MSRAILGTSRGNNSLRGFLFKDMLPNVLSLEESEASGTTLPNEINRKQKNHRSY
ncbi:hypothetical protein J2T20_001625 [Paenibacillus wynnii]|nr:hypothetical protein [Paenibacillus wynnii]